MPDFPLKKYLIFLNKCIIFSRFRLKISSGDLIGECFTTTRELFDDDKCFELINPKKQEKHGKSYKHSGILILKKIKKSKK
jgi:hypothetical protein